MPWRFWSLRKKLVEVHNFDQGIPRILCFQSSKALQMSTGYGPLADILIPEDVWYRGFLKMGDPQNHTEDVSRVLFGWWLGTPPAIRISPFKWPLWVLAMSTTRWNTRIERISQVFFQIDSYRIIYCSINPEMHVIGAEKFWEVSSSIAHHPLVQRTAELLFDSSIFGQTGPATSCYKGQQTCAIHVALGFHLAASMPSRFPKPKMPSKGAQWKKTVPVNKTCALKSLIRYNHADS